MVLELLITVNQIRTPASLNMCEKSTQIMASFLFSRRSGHYFQSARGLDYV